MKKKAKIRYKIFELTRRILKQIIYPYRVIKAGNKLSLKHFKTMYTMICRYTKEVIQLIKNPTYYSMVDWYNEIVISPTYSGLPFFLTEVIGYKTGNPVIRLSYVNNGFGYFEVYGMDCQIGLLIDGTVVYGKDYDLSLKDHPDFIPEDFIINPSDEELEQCKKFIDMNKIVLFQLDQIDIIDDDWVDRVEQLLSNNLINEVKYEQKNKNTIQSI